MGLDMYLNGRKNLWDRKRVEDGFTVNSVEIELGYWRKHPNLHGFIVKTFANGKDECQVIELDEDKLKQLIAAVEQDRLIPTTGFFFGASDGSEKEGDLKILNAALAWLNGVENKGDEYRTVYYQASW